MNVATALMSRFKEEWTAPSHRLRPLHGLMEQALATADRTAAKRVELARSGAFSEKGLTEVRIPTYPVSRSDDIRSVIPEHPVTFGSTPLRLVS